MLSWQKIGVRWGFVFFQMLILIYFRCCLVNIVDKKNWGSMGVHKNLIYFLISKLSQNKSLQWTPGFFGGWCDVKSDKTLEVRSYQIDTHAHDWRTRQAQDTRPEKHADDTHTIQYTYEARTQQHIHNARSLLVQDKYIRHKARIRYAQYAHTRAHNTYKTRTKQ
jgi:hypothetical protein